MARLLELELQTSGYEVELAHDGLTGLERALSGDSAAAASCSGTPCNQSAATLCSSCNPPGCTGIFVQQYIGFFTGDVAGGAPFCSPGTGVGALNACDGRPHSVQSNCTQAKTEADGASSGAETINYYCCSATPATCISRFQCGFGAGNDGKTCCVGGTCTGGTCV